jgi:hypothetical protein
VLVDLVTMGAGIVVVVVRLGSSFLMVGTSVAALSFVIAGRGSEASVRTNVGCAVSRIFSEVDLGERASRVSADLSFFAAREDVTGDGTGVGAALSSSAPPRAPNVAWVRVAG